MLLALALWSPPWIVRHVILDPPRHEELRPALEYLAAHLRGGDRVYVYYFTRSAFAYYTEVSPVAGAGAIRDVAPILGQGVRLAHEAIGDVRDLDALDRAARVWLVFSHARTLGGVDEEARFGEQLSAMGCRRRDEFRVVGASIRLFECRAGISGS
jgi:hypothetical protein